MQDAVYKTQVLIIVRCALSLYGMPTTLLGHVPFLAQRIRRGKGLTCSCPQPARVCCTRKPSPCILAGCVGHKVWGCYRNIAGIVVRVGAVKLRPRCGDGALSSQLYPCFLIALCLASPPSSNLMNWNPDSRDPRSSLYVCKAQARPFEHAATSLRGVLPGSNVPSRYAILATSSALTPRAFRGIRFTTPCVDEIVLIRARSLHERRDPRSGPWHSCAFVPGSS